MISYRDVMIGNKKQEGTANVPSYLLTGILQFAVLARKYYNRGNAFTALYFKKRIYTYKRLRMETYSMLLRKDVMKLSGPVIAEQTLLMIMGTLNAIMAGRMGKEAVSAIGMVDSINNIFISFFSALAVGGTVVVAHYAGQRNDRGANEAARHALFAGTALAGAVTLLLFLFRYPLVGLLFGSADPRVIDNSHVYLNITLLTYPLIALSTVGYGVLRGAGDTRTPMFISTLMNLLNILFSLPLIYGVHISPLGVSVSGLGIRGAAMGIAFARTIGACLVLLTLVRGNKCIRLKIDRSFRLDFDLLKSIFGIGVPASVESLLFNSGKLINQVYIVGMGTATIAANYVAGAVFGLINIPGGALSIAAMTLVGQHMGRGEKAEAKDTLLYLTKLSSLCLLVLCVIAFPFSGLLASLYTDNKDVVRIATTLIRTAVFTMPLLWSVSFLIPSGLKGAGDAKYTMIVSILGMWVFRITLGYILGVPLKLGIIGVWAAMYVDWLVRGTLFYIRLKHGKWQERVVIKKAQEVSLS
jgi:putative MATE family efflux protein